MSTIPFFHMDVFSGKPLSGNGLIVFTEAAGFSDAVMLRLTQEMRQFESIFLTKTGDKKFRARVFTVEEELDFAGHPVLGAAALLHDLHGDADAGCSWEFELNAKTVGVVTNKVATNGAKMPGMAAAETITAGGA